MRHVLLLLPLATMILTQPAFAQCIESAPPNGSREAAFVQQITERTPKYLKEFGVPGDRGRQGPAGTRFRHGERGNQ
ncbi:MAG: hypothetical protein ABIO86_08595 [Sphingomonas sp.]